MLELPIYLEFCACTLVGSVPEDQHAPVSNDSPVRNDWLSKRLGVAGGLDPQFDGAPSGSGTPAGAITGDQGAYSAVAVQPDGSIVAVNPSSSTDTIVRYDDTGAADGTTFAAISQIPNISAVAVQPQGAGFNIVVAGSNYSAGNFTYTLGC